MSLNFLMDDENQPVVWRGPIVGNAVRQFWTDVVWEELDYLLIDMPPGTGDVALTVLQNMPVNGIVMVSTPQPMVSMIVSKAINMCKEVDVYKRQEIALVLKFLMMVYSSVGRITLRYKIKRIHRKPIFRKKIS